MTRWILIRRSLRFHARAHLGVLLGAVIASAVLTGALLVGDSMRQTLVDRALARLGPIEFALSTPDRLFLRSLAARLQSRTAPDSPSDRVAGALATALSLPGTVANQDGSARVNQANILGVDEQAWPTLCGWKPDMLKPAGSNALANSISPGLLADWSSGDVAFINEALANRLSIRVDDEIICRVKKPAALAQDAVISPRDDSTVAMRLRVGYIIPEKLLADFSFVASQLPVANVFLSLSELQRRLGMGNQANLMVARSMTGVERQTLALDAAKPAETDSPAQQLRAALRQSWQLGDAQLTVSNIEPPLSLTGGEPVAPFVELSTSRIFLEPRIVQAALAPGALALTNIDRSKSENPAGFALSRNGTNGIGVLTYLANLLQAGDRATPYSMVASAGSPLIPPEMQDDEIMVNEWLARDLQINPGDRVDLSYYLADSASRLIQRTNTFTVRCVVPIKGLYADRTLMPEFPGLAKAESTHDWDAGFPLVYPIRDKDEAYWRQYRGTPKAFITLAAGQAMWGNRFGNLTAIRYPLPPGVPAAEFRDAVERSLRARLDPAEFGLSFHPVRAQALRAANQSQDFGQLFLGFSFFLIVAALLLMVLLFQFSLEQRASETGTLLALGFTPRQVRRFFLLEGAVIALLGGILGAVAGVGYAKAMLWALVTHWRSAVGTALLVFHASPATLFIGVSAGTAVALFTVWLTLRKQARQPAAALLAGEIFDASQVVTARQQGRGHRSHGMWSSPFVANLCGGVCLLVALALVAWAFMSGASSPGAFFGAGSLLLLSGTAFIAARLTLPVHSRSSRQAASLLALGLRGTARRRNRSLATIALLACGAFLVISIGVFRLDSSQDAWRRESGTGGFALLGESALPIVRDLNSSAGREALGFGDNDLADVRAVPFRVRQGDDASCLNLNRAQKPRLLGVHPELLSGRFTFTSAAEGLSVREGWGLLKSPSQNAGPETEEVPAIGDANSIQWALGKRVGDTIDYTDEHGRNFKLRLVGAVANSLLQGNLIIDEDQFTRRFPSESGYRFFLFDAPSNAVASVSATLARALQDAGLELTPATQRLSAFNAVQNTYLGTFQILGGLGLLLGSAGLGVVVLRNVLERRGELAVLLAVGFRHRALQRFVLFEHGVLLVLGLSLGVLSAFVAVLPSLLKPGTPFPTASLSLTLVGVLLNGVVWTWIATRSALRGELLQALRNE